MQLSQTDFVFINEAAIRIVSAMVGVGDLNLNNSKMSNYATTAYQMAYALYKVRDQFYKDMDLELAPNQIIAELKKACMCLTADKAKVKLRGMNSQATKETKKVVEEKSIVVKRRGRPKRIK